MTSEDPQSSATASLGNPSQTKAILARFAPAGLTTSPATLKVARKRLGAIALSLAAMTVLSFLAVWLFEPLPQVEGIRIAREYLAELGILLDLAMVGIAWKSNAKDEDIPKYTYVYWVLRCATLSLSPVTDEGKVATLTWVTVMVVLFPVMAPPEGVRGKLALTAAAATQPLTPLLLDLIGFDVHHSEQIRSFLSAGVALGLGLIGGDLIRRYTVEAPKELGSYDLVDRLGRGGMGEVWRATHRFLARPAAIKLIPRSPDEDPLSTEKKLRRFRREAQVTANLTSPHTVAVYDFGVTDAGVYYYVMEHLVGEDLNDLVRKEGPLSPGRAVHLIIQACDSLAEAHTAGLIHRDLKPSNLFVVRQGIEPDFLKVLDFGLVGLQEPLRNMSVDVQITGANMMTGTPAYMSPEMVKGTEIDPRADIYGIGCILFFLLTGELVFPGLRGMPMALAHAHEIPRIPREVRSAIPDDLSELILDCLAKDPKDRPPSALALQERLEDLPCAQDWNRHKAQAWWDKHFPPSPTANMQLAVRRSEEDPSAP